MWVPTTFIRRWHFRLVYWLLATEGLSRNRAAWNNHYFLSSFTRMLR